MLKTLIKSRIDAIISAIIFDNKNKKRRSTVAVILISLMLVLLVGIIVASLSFLFYAITLIGKETGDNWATMTLASLVASLFCVIGSIFATKTQIFDSKDNELLLSMPIKPRSIFLSRIIVLLVVNYLLESLIMVPAMIIYGVVCSYTPLGFVFAILSYLLIPVFTLAVSTIIAWIVSFVSSHVKNKTAVSVVLYLVLFLGYMYLCFNMGYSAGADDGNIDLSGLKSTAIFYCVGEAAANGDWLCFLLFALTAIIPSVVIYIVLDFSFIKILTTKKTAAKIEYKGNTQKASSAFGGLVKKELSRFFKSSAYIMNAGMGNILMIVVAIVAAVSSSSAFDLVEELASELSLVNPQLASFLTENTSGIFALLISCIALFLNSTNIVSAPSISLEDKNLWILQCAPVSARQVVFAKIVSHLIICTPAPVIATLIACIALEVTVAHTIMCLLVILSAVVFTAYLGMLLGLKFPKFGWQNENVAIKQGFAVFGSMFGSMLLGIILIALGIFGITTSYYVSSVLMLTPSLIFAIIIHLYLYLCAENNFEKIRN